MKKQLRVPGPTEVPEEVLRESSKQMIGHRSTEYMEMFKKISEDIKQVFMTENDVLIFPGAGTGGMEAAIVNLFSPGDKVLVLSAGVFGDRFAEIAASFGLRVEKLTFDPGQCVNPDKVRERMKKDREEIKAVIVTHNETSTGVLNDIKEIKSALGDFPGLFIVDAVSSLGAAELKTDEWGVDVVVTGSQKALMTPPGLTLISVSEKAWKACESSKLPKYYWSFVRAREYLKKGQNPYTPAVQQIYALKEAVRMILEEGLDNVFSRHRKLSKAFRHGIRGMGLELFVKDEIASPTVTAVKIPENLNFSNFKKLLKTDFNIEIAGGQKELKNKIFRFGHMGYIDEKDILACISAIEICLKNLGLPIKIGSGITAAEKILIKGE